MQRDKSYTDVQLSRWHRRKCIYLLRYNERYDAKNQHSTHTLGNILMTLSRRVVPPVTRPCNPNPCGPNSICRELNGQAVCTCAPEFLGSPPLCRPECILSSDCRQNEACANQRCKDPCPGTCGIQARCTVVNHNPICSCPERFTGDPFIRCDVMSKR